MFFLYFICTLLLQGTFFLSLCMSPVCRCRKGANWQDLYCCSYYLLLLQLMQISQKTSCKVARRASESLLNQSFCCKPESCADHFDCSVTASDVNGISMIPVVRAFYFIIELFEYCDIRSI